MSGAGTLQRPIPGLESPRARGCLVQGSWAVLWSGV